jgi:pimeloyl-ACP methyl ester carboxylesterase
MYGFHRLCRKLWICTVTEEKRPRMPNLLIVSKRERRDERTIWRSVSTISSKVAFCVVAVVLVTAFGFGANIQRPDFFIAGGAGQLHVREVHDEARSVRKAVLLVHGGGPGGIPSFDLPIPGYSLAEDCARQNVLVFVMDIRGWGSSTRPSQMDQPPESSAPLVSAKEAADDIATVVNWIVNRTRQKVVLVGWASGGHWTCTYAARERNDLSHLILLNTLYAVNSSWELRSSMQDKEDAQQFDHHAGGYRLADQNALLRRWDGSIPTSDKTIWREPEVAEAYVRVTLESDPTSSRRSPPSVRIPIGYLRDAFNLSLGRPLFDAALIRVATLILRGEFDFWSRPADPDALQRDLVNAPKVRTVTIRHATHYLFLDRPNHGRSRFISEVLKFLKNGDRNKEFTSKVEH